jgi:hypothetical protein
MIFMLATILEYGWLETQKAPKSAIILENQFPLGFGEIVNIIKFAGHFVVLNETLSEW